MPPQNADDPKPVIAMRPCPMAIAAMTVPARRWGTRTELLVQLERALQFLRESPPEEFSVRSVAAVAGLSVHHFLRLFHEVYGITPREFVAKRQFDQAKQMLEDSELTISEIASEVGFGNASAFSRFFRTHEGCTPTQYRQNRRPGP
jgi:AraC-like DNA-binding protein